jgi:hypothetical protein
LKAVARGASDDMKWLCNTIAMGSPLNNKLPFGLWSLDTIRAVLQKERSLLLSKSSLCRLLSHLGLNRQRPLYKSYRLNPDHIKSYLAKSYPEAVAKAKAHRARICFVEEAAFRSDAMLIDLGHRLDKRNEKTVYATAVIQFVPKIFQLNFLHLNHLSI